VNTSTTPRVERVATVSFWVVQPDSVKAMIESGSKLRQDQLKEMAEKDAASQ
jgi:hypothetical protein